MWCRNCQQDVPAVAKSVEGPLVCTRCEAEFEIPGRSTPADHGVSLEAIDQSRQPVAPLDPWEKDEMEQRLRRIGRQLRSAYRHDVDFGMTRSAQPTWGPEALDLHAAPSRFSAAQGGQQDPVRSARPTFTSGLVSLLLMAGVIGLLGGVGTLIWSAAFGLEQAWQWGMTVTFAAEGALIVGLTWMAGRLWHNSRRLNRQIDGVDRQLHELEHLTGSLSASNMSSSQHYYQHFNQGASSHMLLANLRGQVDQLASRMAA